MSPQVVLRINAASERKRHDGNQSSRHESARWCVGFGRSSELRRVSSQFSTIYKSRIGKIRHIASGTAVATLFEGEKIYDCHESFCCR